jgi:phospholipid-binding lipoprotein MlaA
MTIYFPLRRLLQHKAPLVATIFALGLSACAPAPVPQGIDDPFEAQNRATHALNLKLDTYVVRPLANKATRVVPDPVFRSVSNFAGNLDLPGIVANDLLQGKIGPAQHASVCCELDHRDCRIV